MINKELKKYLTNEVDSYTENIRNILESDILPTFYDLKASRRSGYLYKGFYKNQSYENKIIFLIKNLPVNPNIRQEYKGKLQDLINTGEVKPFLIFLGRRMIKWSNIELIMDCKNIYLYISNISTNDLEKDIKCILLPSKSSYIENTNEVGDLTFDSRGRYITEVTGNYCVSINLPKDLYGGIVCKSITSVSDQLIDTGIPPEYSISNNNILVFNETKYGNEICFTNEYKFKNLGFNMINLTRNKDDKLFIVIFYGLKVKCKDITTKFKNKTYAKELITNCTDQIKDMINEKFRLNSTNSLENAMQYDSSLLKDYYKEKIEVQSEVISGKEFKSRVNKDTGYIHFHQRQLNSRVIIFHNRKLYKYNNLIKVETDILKVPILGIEDEDIIEIVYFLDVNNYIAEIVFDSNTDDYSYSYNDRIPIKDAKVYCELSEDEEFNISGTGVQYEVPLYKDINTLKLLPNNHFYFDKKVSLVSAKRFAHFHTKLPDNNIISVTLPKEFSFCTDINRYMIFINGLLLDKSKVMITLPTENRPFNDITIYFDVKLYKTTTIDVYYLPININKINYVYNNDKKEIPNSGIITVDRNELNYNLSKDLYFVFLGGKKLSPNDLYDIKANSIRVMKNVNCLNELHIFKLYEDEQEIQELFNTIESRYDQLTNLLTDKEIRYLFNGVTITNEENIKYNTVSRKTILYEIIRKYYMLPSIYKDNGKEIFNYDFEGKENFVEMNNCTLFTYLNANLEDKL